MKIVRNIKEKLLYLVKEGFFHILIGNVLVKMIAFVSSIVIVRLVSKQDYAYLGYADNLYQYINLLSGLGLSTAILKFCSPNIRKGLNKYYYFMALKAGTVFQLAASLMLIIIVYCSDIPFPNARGIVLALVLYPAMTQVVTTMQSYIRAQLNNKLYAKIGVIQTVVLFISSFALAFLIGIYGVAISRYISMVAVIVLAYKFIRADILQDAVSEVPEKQEVRFFWKIAISMMLANLFSMIMPINEMFLINSHIKDAILIPSQIVFITSSVVVYIFPKIAQMGNRLKDALRITIKTELVLLGITVCVCVVGYFISPILITVVYGDRYADAIELSKIYWIVYGINAGFRMLPMNVLPAIGSTTFNSGLSIISCIAHGMILNQLLTRYGIWGAPYALVLIYIASGIIYWIYLMIKCKKN